ncbi:hypothetical protein FFIC_230530 [Fructobacillus ficulneus]|uniref:Uncharacterized protein n=2 Tax=Fructobacillus ficulneus TaxID=157463 RepID=A0A0K8MI82_9LACO|nr:hypothetical protein FFIC_230530 [Fructobacillus ficulneus]
MILTVIGFNFYVQTQIIDQKIKSIVLINQTLIVDRCQVDASLDYYQNHKLSGTIAEAEYQINSDQGLIEIKYQKQVYQRPLLLP